MSEAASVNKNLNTQSLGIGARQSELNELALTYGFQCLDVDMAEIAERAEKYDLTTATMFLHLPIGQFALPVSLQGDEAAFAKALESLKKFLEFAKAIKATRCVHVLESGSDELPYHENFERHRTRIGQIAQLMKEHGIQLGLGVSGASASRGERQFQFVQQADDLLTFITTIGADNVGLALDTWNWKLAGGSLDQIRELGADKIVAVTLADIPAEADLDSIDDTQRQLPRNGGLVDNAGVVALLVELGYSGPITLMPSPEHVSGARDAIVEKVSKMLDELWSPPAVPEPSESSEEEGETVASAE